MGRVSKAKAIENREMVIAAAARLFRQQGIASVTVADIMAEAGLTHGGFYGQFESKEALAAEAVRHAFDAAEGVWAEYDTGSGPDRLGRLASSYLAAPEDQGCLIPTLALEVARSSQGSDLRNAYLEGVRGLVDRLSRDLRDDSGLGVFAAMIGARFVRRALDDESLADAIDIAVARIASSSFPGYEMQNGPSKSPVE